MTPKDDLFRLIKSLSRNEKGYFRKDSQATAGTSGSNYLRLFDAIDLQDEYDEAALRKKFSGEKFVKQFHVAKNYLFNLILKSLESYHSSVDSELQSQLHRIEILYEKGFFDMCADLLPRLREKAITHERFAYLLNCFEWERRILLTGGRSQIKKEELEEILEQGNAALRKMVNHHEYQSIYNRLFFFIMRTGRLRTKEHQKEFELLSSSPLLENEALALSHRTRLLFNSIHYFCSFYSHNETGVNAGIKFQLRRLQLIETHPAGIRENPKEYIIILCDLLAHFGDQCHDDFFIYLEKIRSVEKDYEIKLPPELRAKIFFCAYSAELNYYSLCGEFSKLATLLPEIEKGISSFDKFYFSPTKLSLHFNIAYCHFGCGEYRAAMKWLNYMVNDTTKGIRPDHHCIPRIVLLIVHYELGNTDLLSYAISSTERYFLKNKRMYKGESLLLELFRKTLKAKSGADEKKLFISMKVKLEELMKDPYERNGIYYFDFLCWLESRITGKPFSALVKMKHAAKTQTAF
ncbi:MAG: hypothetical protein HY064_00220 [Bacteroidetes bacterium]|nr:hypothetical protein [Bacteroidota bacterium]